MNSDTTRSIERWGRFELALAGPTSGNPFTDVQFGACFSYQHRTIDVAGFYDGDGTYRVRFMPDTPGVWRYTTVSSDASLNNINGEFVCSESTPSNHGPVAVHRGYHFAYADGTPYVQIGTTCYAWIHQGEELERQTLETLRNAPFNKLRMCIFPKHYPYNANEPPLYPFEQSGAGWDFTRFNPAFFQHLEQRIDDLLALEIEADLILFHPYDRWGFAAMSAEADDRYLRYVVARLAAFRNIWWSMANEYDVMPEKATADWDRFFRIVQENDPYQHPRSIHNCRGFYDHARPWVTHQSIQHADLAQTRTWREQYRKPVIVDECCYEGNIPQSWGNISGRELVHRFWEGTTRGGYVGHGETFLHPDDILWWSKGGVLHGESPARIAFLRSLLADAPLDGLDPIDGVVPASFPCAGKAGDYYLIYFGVHQPARINLKLPEGRFTADVIDPWEMTVTPIEQALVGACVCTLPGQPYMALRLRRTG